LAKYRNIKLQMLEEPVAESVEPQIS
jgi:hypothetical protein